MKKISIIVCIFIFSLGLLAQDGNDKKNMEIKKGDNAKDSDAMSLAKETFKAHGGENLKNMKTLVINGSVDLTVSSFPQAMPATFATVFSDDKYLMQINSQFANFKQSFDGTDTHNSEGGFSLPPINRLGFPLLQKLGETGFVVSELTDKKKYGFRITSPEGYYTDFYIDKKTNQIKGYDSSYEFNNRPVTTSVSISKYETREMVVVPQKYSQRFDMGQMTVYAEFKAKEILVNSTVKDEVFASK